MKPSLPPLAADKAAVNLSELLSAVPPDPGGAALDEDFPPMNEFVEETLAAQTSEEIPSPSNPMAGPPESFPGDAAAPTLEELLPEMAEAAQDAWEAADEERPEFVNDLLEGLF